MVLYIVFDIAVLTGWTVAKLLASGIYSIIAYFWKHERDLTNEELYTKVVQKLQEIHKLETIQVNSAASQEK